MSDQEILDSIRKEFTTTMQEITSGKVPTPLDIYFTTQTYLLLKILDMLETINTNIMDVEKAVQRLDPVYRD